MRRLALLLLALLAAAPGDRLTGVVIDAAGQPVEGARVRLRASSVATLTGPDGRFVLADPAAAPGAQIAAARPGHIIGGATLRSGISDYRIVLPAIPAGDDPTYPWVTAVPEDDEAPRTDFGREPCGACHRRILAEWQASAHARSAVNPRFLAAVDGAAGRGDCGSCHVPMAADDHPGRASGVAREGVGCDVCHKIAEVRPGAGDRTGIRAVDLRRPPFGRQTVFGPFDDVPRGRDAFAPVYRESRYCAVCHQARIGGIPVYTEFEEWQASRYATAGITCQACHMKGDGQATAMVDLGPGRIERDPSTLSSHRFHDSRSPGLLAGAVAVAVEARDDGNLVTVDIEVANRGVGHHLPAGAPMRHMLLIVSSESGGRSLAPVDGPTLPPWAGADLAGKPGRVWAKLLTDGFRRPVSHWESAALDGDNRIPAGGADRLRFGFASGGAGAAVSVRLVIRRTFADRLLVTGLDDVETILAERRIVVAPPQPPR